MAPLATALLRAARTRPTAFRPILAAPSPFRTGAPRFQGSGAGAGQQQSQNQGQGQQSQGQQGPESWFKRMWDSPIGLKTVHFWAPVMKWALVLAGISDFARPAENLSLTQNGALTATGIIWTRWCLIIKPKNYLLAAVNFFMGCVGVVQVTRIFLYQRAQKRQGLLEGEVKHLVETGKSS